MRHKIIALSIACMASGSVAAEIAPSDVTLGEYGAVEVSLTGQPGDPESGAQVVMDRKLGNCLACHANSDMADQPFHGEVGPMLDGVADRWSEAELRGMLVNSKNMFPGTIMPAFYVETGYTRPNEEFVGKTILTAQQIEDVVAYLSTLKY